jgi:methionine--tRNA ligase beta chain
MISIEEFANVDIRIGTVVSADVPTWSHWVMRLTVDFGEEIKQRTIFSGIMKFYKPEDVIGKQFPFVVNLAPKRIGPKDENGEYAFSEGMMIMAAPGEETSEDTAPVFFNLSAPVPNGTKVR